VVGRRKGPRLHIEKLPDSKNRILPNKKKENAMKKKLSGSKARCGHGYEEADQLKMRKGKRIVLQGKSIAGRKA